MYWTKTGWNAFKSDIQSLATSLSRYAKYLTDQNDRMKWVHLSPIPIHTIADNLSFQFLSPNASSIHSPTLEEIEGMWCHLKAIDDTVTFDEKWVRSALLNLYRPHPHVQYPSVNFNDNFLLL